VIAVVRARVRNNYHSMTAQNHADASSYEIHIARIRISHACRRHELHMSAPIETHIVRKRECRTRAGDMSFA